MQHTDPSVHSLLSREFSHGKVGNHQLFALDLGPLVRISGGGSARELLDFFGGLRTFSSWGWINLGVSPFVTSDRAKTVHRASGSPVVGNIFGWKQKHNTKPRRLNLKAPANKPANVELRLPEMGICTRFIAQPITKLMFWRFLEGT